VPVAEVGDGRSHGGGVAAEGPERGLLDEAAGNPELLREPGILGAEFEGRRRPDRRLEDRPTLASRSRRVGGGLRTAVDEVLDQPGIAVESQEVMGPDARHEGG